MLATATSSTVPSFDVSTLSQASREALLAMAKALPKSSPRSYATTIGLRNGKACFTDGFSLLEYRLEGTPRPHTEVTLDRNLFQSSVKFPDWERIVISLEEEGGESLSASQAGDILTLANSVGTKRIENVYLMIENGQCRISIGTKDREGVRCFNPWLLKNLLKALPKGATASSGWLTDDNLLIDVAKADGTVCYKLVLCSVKLAK